MVMLKLFLAFSKISMFAFGGAYSFLPLMEAELVQNHQWLNESEFLEITESKGLANSPWPKFRGTITNSGANLASRRNQ